MQILSQFSDCRIEASDCSDAATTGVFSVKSMQKADFRCFIICLGGLISEGHCMQNVDSNGVCHPPIIRYNTQSTALSSKPSGTRNWLEVEPLADGAVPRLPA